MRRVGDLSDVREESCRVGELSDFPGRAVSRPTREPQQAGRDVAPKLMTRAPERLRRALLALLFADA